MSCRLLLDGAKAWEGDCASTRSAAVGGLAYSRNYTARLEATSSSGTTLSPGSDVRTNDAPPPPPPQPEVIVEKGDSAQGRPGCSSNACRMVKVTYANFAAGEHTVVCRATGEEGGYYTYRTSSTTSAVCYYGYPGQQVWVTVDGVPSNRITW